MNPILQLISAFPGASGSDQPEVIIGRLNDALRDLLNGDQTPKNRFAILELLDRQKRISQLLDEGKEKLSSSLAAEYGDLNRLFQERGAELADYIDDWRPPKTTVIGPLRAAKPGIILIAETSPDQPWLQNVRDYKMHDWGQWIVADGKEFSLSGKPLAPGIEWSGGRAVKKYANGEVYTIMNPSEIPYRRAPVVDPRSQFNDRLSIVPGQEPHQKPVYHTPYQGQGPSYDQAGLDPRSKVYRPEPPARPNNRPLGNLDFRRGPPEGALPSNTSPFFGIDKDAFGPNFPDRDLDYFGIPKSGTQHNYIVPERPPHDTFTPLPHDRNRFRTRPFAHEGYREPNYSVFANPNPIINQLQLGRAPHTWEARVGTAIGRMIPSIAADSVAKEVYDAIGISRPVNTLEGLMMGPEARRHANEDFALGARGKIEQILGGDGSDTQRRAGDIELNRNTKRVIAPPPEKPRTTYNPDIHGPRTAPQPTTRPQTEHERIQSGYYQRADVQENLRAAKDHAAKKKKANEIADKYHKILVERGPSMTPQWRSDLERKIDDIRNLRVPIYNY